MDKWVVHVKGSAFVFGPFSLLEEAQDFQYFLSTHVDPTEILPVRSHVAELLRWVAFSQKSIDS